MQIFRGIEKMTVSKTPPNSIVCADWGVGTGLFQGGLME
jgi:hypothetical protein